MPLQTVIPIDRRVFAPAPVANTNGMTPRIKAKGPLHLIIDRPETDLIIDGAICNDEQGAITIKVRNLIITGNGRLTMFNATIIAENILSYGDILGKQGSIKSDYALFSTPDRWRNLRKQISWLGENNIVY